MNAISQETLKDCDFCPEMVKIEPGKFTMGSSLEESGHTDEKPQREVNNEMVAKGGIEPPTQGFSVINISSALPTELLGQRDKLYWKKVKNGGKNPP